MPLINQTFSQLITFTRASSATYVDARGLIQSASTNVPRFDYNPSTLAPRGLLIEEQRTNLLTYSQSLDPSGWTRGTGATYTDSQLSPEGTNNAVLANGLTTISIVPTAAVVYHTASTAVVAGTIYTFSTYAKLSSGDGSAFTLRVRTGSGASFTSTQTINSSTWTRVTLTFTVPVGEVSCQVVIGSSGASVSAFLYGAQLEAGSFATSYIPTVASQVTRAADLASLNTLSSWFNATEGTLFANYDQNSSTQSGGGLFVQSDGTNNNRILLTADGASSGTIQPGLYVTDTSVAQVAIVAGTGTINSTNKLAAAYKVNDFAASFNGAASVTDSVGTVPFVDRSYIGAGATGTSGFINGHIRRIVFYPSRLSNANLQTITA